MSSRVLLPIAFAALTACGNTTTPSPFNMSVDSGGPDSGLPTLDAAADDRPDRPRPDAIDFTDSPAPDVPSDDVTCTSVLASGLRFGRDGGKVAYADTFTLTPPLAFRAERRMSGSTTVSAMCETTIPLCNTADMVDVGEVNAALANMSVVTAFGMARAMPIVYGYDPRPADGTVYLIEKDGARVYVGDPCRVGMMTGCLEIPTGLQHLVDVLRALADQERLRSACMSFPR